MDKKYMAIMAVVCFMVVSAGFVSILDDADAADEVSVVSYDSRAENGGQLVLNATTTPVLHTAVINGINFSGKYTPGKALEMTRTHDAELSKPLGAGTYSSIELKNSAGVVGTFDLSLYDVTFDSNGGTGTVDPIVAYGNVTLPDGTGLTSPDASKTFLGWSDDSSATAAKYTDAIDVRSNVTLYAVWGTAAPTNFTVTINVSDTELGTVDTPSVTVASGSSITINGAEITIGTEKVIASIKEVTGHTVKFDKWNGVPTGNTVTSDVTITAVFKKTVNQYTITFDTDGGSAVASITQDYGTPVTAPADPTKTGYTFKGWNPVVPATMPAGDMTITAQWEVNKYKITWQNDDGTELRVDDVPYGDMPSYGTAPTKAATAQYTYTFDKWTPEVVSVTGDATYKASYTSVVNKYTITWQNDDGSELESKEVEYGATPAYTGATPAKAATAQYTYTFDKWTPEVVSVTGEATYTASYTATVNKYKITWQDDDGSELRVDDVPYGDIPSYGTAPTKDATAQYTYTFDKWTPEVVSVTGEATYTASYTATVNKYTVSIVVNDVDMGSVSSPAVTEVPYGTPVTAVSNVLNVGREFVTATAASNTAEFTFSFDKWEFGDGFDGENVVGPATVTAVFKKTVNTYTVTVVSGNSVMGTVSQDKVVVPYGSDIRTSGSTLTVSSESVTATPADKTDEFTYSFDGWSENATGKVFGDMTIVANFKAETNKYPVTVAVNDSTMGSATFYLDGTKIDSGTEVEYGKTVTLSISQEKGYMLTSVKFNGEDKDNMLVHVFTVGVKNEFEVGFTKTTELQFTVTLTCGDNGSIIPGADGKCVLKGESSQDFQISADFGYKIKSVKLDGIVQDLDSKVSAVVPIKNIVADHEIVAEFEKADTYSVQLIGASNGKVDITGLDADGKAVEGRTITITATPNFGFYASKFLVNGKDIDLTLGADSESRTISVDKSLDGDKIVVEVKFALSATADDDDDPVPSPNPSGPETGGKGGNSGSAKVVAAAAACVVVVVAALCIAFWRKN